MSDDITRPEARPLTAMIAGGDSQAKQAFFIDTMKRASAFVVNQEMNGSISWEECHDRINAIQAMSEELRFGGSCACATCGDATSYLFVNDDNECVWCSLQKQADEETKRATLQPVCEHIDFSDNLTGATCNDCGEVV